MSDPGEDVKKKRVKITRVDPDNILTTYVNDLAVSHSNDEFFLTFSLLEPPMIFVEGDIEGIDKAEAVARTKLVVTPEFMEKVIKTLSRLYDNYKQGLKQDADKV